MRRKSSNRARLIRAAAWSVVAVGAATPLVRRKLKLHPAAVLGAVFSAPAALAVAAPSSRKRDLSIYALQMWGYFTAYDIPGDDMDALIKRARVTYPVKGDSLIGFGQIPTVRLQNASNPGELKLHDYLLAWSHWLWFLFPHLSVIYMLVYRRERFARSAAMVAGVFDTGALIHIAVPTAPPWVAAQEGVIPPIRRIMTEVGAKTWGSAWEKAFESLSGNPVAAMPSLHFGTSVMAAAMLRESGPVAGTLGWAYALTLGYALVYMGEHYVVDLLAGYALTRTVRGAGEAIEPFTDALNGGIRYLSEKAGT